MSQVGITRVAVKSSKREQEDIAFVKETAKRSAFIGESDKFEINWVHMAILVVPPTLALYGSFTTALRWETLLWGVIMYFWTGMGITAGYHRLWSHRAFSARWIVRLMLCIGGAAAFEGSAKWWCRNHRAHHRYTDTDKDPYNAKKGFWYSHLGWMIQKQNVKSIGFADISDLHRDPMIMWQHKYYPLISIGFGIVMPTLVAGLWGDMRGGYFYASLWRMVFVHHATFCVNSLAHWWGDKTYSDFHTAFDSVITAVLTLGEGYHNYHHEFPSDYRNGIKFYHYDPTKWLVKGLSYFGLTYNLRMMEVNEIEKARVQMQQRHIDEDRAELFGKTEKQLPALTWEDIRARVTKGEKLIVLENVVHDVKDFVDQHPGGRQTLLNVLGRDVTSFFKGVDAEHNHTKEAYKFLNAMGVGTVREDHLGA
jgi:stearoyl-CoA desaturase (delta-9 desaturase)